MTLFDFKAHMPRFPTAKEYPFWNEPAAFTNYVDSRPAKYSDLDFLDRKNS